MSGPFGTIVLSISGGGTRAVGFHLGTLAYLDRLGVLEDVRALSSVSGGSFVATTYALSLERGKPFTEYFDWVTRAIGEAQMVEWCLEHLASGTPRCPSGRRSLITSLAEMYDRHFFRGVKFGVFWDDEPESHLEEVIINATDFKTGLAFRFQRHGRVGNARMFISPDEARHLRLADVMAASSCIPGGLEPFFFPDDFVWEGDGARSAYEGIRQRFARQGVEAVPLMDGGVYDNQGIESIMLAVERMARRRASRGAEAPGDHHEDRLAEGAALRSLDLGRWFGRLLEQGPAGREQGWAPGLFIVSDTPLVSDPVYRAGYAPGSARPLRPLPPARPGGMTLGRLNVLMWLLAAVCVLTALAVLWHGADAIATSGLRSVWRDVDDVFAYVTPLVLSAAAALGIIWLRRRARGVLGTLDRVLRIEGTPAALNRSRPPAWRSLKRLTIRDVGSLLGLRVSSMASLVNDIFMIRIRSLGYALLYGTERYRHRIIANEIHDLERTPGRTPSTDQQPPSRELGEVVERAAVMPTAFWFQRPDDLDTLIACGQATICRNVLEHISREKVRDPGTYTPAVAALFERAASDWERLNADPMAFLPRRAQGS